MLDERTQEQPPDQPAEAASDTPTTPEDATNGRPPEVAAPEATASPGVVEQPGAAAAPPEATAPEATASSGVAEQPGAAPAPPEALAPPATGSDEPASKTGAHGAPAAAAARDPEAAAVPSYSVPPGPEDSPTAVGADAEAAPAVPEEEAAPDASGAAAAPDADAAPDAPARPPGEQQRGGGQQAAPAGKRAARPREPLPWPELRAAAGVVSQSATVEDLKDLFRLLPADVRDETVENVREYRKGARRPVSAFAGKSLARAVHTARRARRRPDSDDAVSEALGQALAAEIIASLEVEIAAEVILPKRDLLEREARNARRRQRDEDLRSRDDRRRRAREEESQQGATFGTYSGAKIRGLDELKRLFDEQQGSGE